VYLCTAAVVVPVVAAGSDFGHVRYCNGHLRDGHLRNSTECGSLRLSRSARAAETSAERWTAVPLLESLRVVACS